MESDFSQAFVGRIAKEWPQLLDEMLNFLLASGEHHNIENTLGRNLSQLLDNEDCPPEKACELINDAVAFELFVTSNSPWGKVRYGPFFSGPTEDGGYFERPGRSRITEDTILQWRRRKEETESAIAKARFADAAWELAQMAGVARDKEDASVALKAMVQAEGWPDDNRAQAERYERAIHLARSISDSDAMAEVLAQWGQSAELETVGNGFPWSLLGFLQDAADNKRHSEESMDRYIDMLLGHYDFYLQNHDGHTAKIISDLLIKIYRRRQDKDSEQTVAKKIGECFEAMASSYPSALAAADFFKTAFRYFRDSQLRDDAERVKRLIADATNRSIKEMARFTKEFNVTREELDEVVKGATEGDLEESVKRLFFSFLPNLDESRKLLDQLASESFVMKVLPREVITEAGNSIHVGPYFEDKESHLIMHLKTVASQINPLFLERSIDVFLNKHQLGALQLSTLCDESLFPESRKITRHRAFAAYLAADYRVYISLIIPQIEHALRLILRLVGVATGTTRDDVSWRQLTLTQILVRKELVEVLSDRGSFYVRFVLTEDLGFNARDLYCHGLVDDCWFCRTIADRLFHVYLGLSLLGFKSDGQE